MHILFKKPAEVYKFLRAQPNFEYNLHLVIIKLRPGVVCHSRGKSASHTLKRAITDIRTLHQNKEDLRLRIIQGKIQFVQQRIPKGTRKIPDQSIADMRTLYQRYHFGD